MTAGLSAAEVAERVARGQTNRTDDRTSRTYPEIFRANILTRFNAILGVMLVIVLSIGSPRDALFGFVLVSNALIGIVQEIRAKRVLDALAILSAPRAHVVREGHIHEVAVEDVVLDDVVELHTGDQVPCDGRIVGSEGLEIDESLLTGESEPVDKGSGDEVLSGSFVVAGAGRFRATAVGNDAYAAKLALEARRFELTHSELMSGINSILRIITWILFPVGAALLWSQIEAGDGLREGLLAMVAGIVGMVPLGLVLLTSLAFAVAAVTLATRKVLVQELPAVEGLARVDVVCLDKTGTLTDGEIVFSEFVPLDDAEDEGRAALAALADDPNANATMAAAGGAGTAPGWQRTAATPFSSARKWSAASFDGHGTWVLGAPEMVWLHDDDEVLRRADELAAGGSRVLVLTRSDATLRDEELPSGMRPIALVLLTEQVRPDAPTTLEYFRDQGVALKVISGDNPRTVAAVATRVGLEGDGGYDARTLPDDREELADVLERQSVFGRVTPHQKRAMVAALQSRGHVVAMTGDGVNDALALKDADIGVAMGSGAAATRAVAQLVLLDGRFSTMPGVVAEGRRVIANIERVANFFLTSTVYTAAIAAFIAITVLFPVGAWEFPFLPRNFTFINVFTIGVPAFFLSLAPNKRRYVPGFVSRVARFAIPAGLVAGAGALTAYGIARAADQTLTEGRTVATLTLITIALWILVILARPFTVWRVVLVAAMVVGIATVLVVPFGRDFFEIEFPDAGVLMGAGLTAVAAIVLLEVVLRATGAIAARQRAT